MEFLIWASAPSSWITARGNDLDGCVIASRVRIARNLSTAPFPHNATPNTQRQTLEMISDALSRSPKLKSSHSFRLNDLTQIQRNFLMERQLISHQHATQKGEKGLVVSSGEQLSIMINEEDHIRAACFEPGLALQDGWATLNDLDDDLIRKLPISYDEDFGFLTAWPTNVGTGLRASCLMHLPALTLTGRGQALLGLVDRARAQEFLSIVRPLPTAERALVAMGVAALSTHAMTRRGRLIKQRPR